MIGQRRFRPTLWATVFTVPSLAILLALGSWQLDRLVWKTALIETFRARVAMPPVAPPLTIPDIEAWRWRPIALTGRFAHEAELHLTGKPFEGSAGFHVITPLILAGGRAGGRIVLVNRGWVPEKKRKGATRPETLPAGEVTVTGLLREDRRRGYFVPDNEPQGEVWLYVDTAEMARARKLANVAPYYVDLFRSPGPYRIPIGMTTKVSAKNDHLHYAITWFALAIALAVIYVIYHYRDPDDDGPQDHSQHAEDSDSKPG